MVLANIYVLCQSIVNIPYTFLISASKYTAPSIWACIEQFHVTSFSVHVRFAAAMLVYYNLQY